MAPLSQEIERLKEYEEVASIAEIVRRYFAMNSFDGILTILGVLVGNYLAESAERQKSLDDLEEYSLMVALPFCHVQLTARKQLLPAYPHELRTLGDHLRKPRIDLGLLQSNVASH
jgi:hypothetical protein